MRLDDIISRRFFIGATLGVVVSYWWHLWTFSNANLLDTVVLTVASEALLLLGSILSIMWVRRKGSR